MSLSSNVVRSCLRDARSTAVNGSGRFLRTGPCLSTSVKRTVATASSARGVTHRGQSQCYKSTFRPFSTTSAPWSAQAAKKVPDNNEPPTPVNPSPNTDVLPLEIPQSGWDERRVAVGWTNGTWSRYHNIWLRDHCRCPSCFHPVTKQRLLDTFSIPKNVHPSKVESTPEGLEVTWPESSPHISFYPWDWLMTNSYDPNLISRTSYDVASHTPKVLWSSRLQSSPPTVSYEEVMKGDRGVLKWLRRIDQFGVCFVEGVPPTPEDTEKLALRIAKLRETQYGTFWDFTSDMAHGDLAYSNIALGAHTDTTYFTDPCGLQIFHLLSHKSGSGGSTLLVDGFYAASILKELHPEHFETLSSVRVPTHAAGDNSLFYKPQPEEGYPVLNLHPVTGELMAVRYNNDDRSALQTEPAIVEAWYDALREWHKCLTSPDSEYWVQLAPGTAVVIDNHRVLHGRSSFIGERRMCGAYIGADDFKSRLRVLEEMEGRKGEDVNRSVWAPSL